MAGVAPVHTDASAFPEEPTSVIHFLVTHASLNPQAGGYAGTVPGMLAGFNPQRELQGNQSLSQGLAI